MIYKILRFLFITVLVFSCQEKNENAKFQTGNSVFLVTLDGFRWQELFSGADSSLITDTEFVEDTSGLLKLFWNEDLNQRRKMLLPFFWSEIESGGVLLGNRDFGSMVNVTNEFWFSYPGYNEILTGFADENINSNNKINNPNETVLEFINKQEGFEGDVAAFTSWDVFPFIINEERSGVYVNAGFEPVSDNKITENEKLLNILQKQVPRTWSTVRVDAFTHHYALEYITKYKPRLLYISYGETDDFAHDGRYGHYLKSANQTDAFIRELWEITRNDPNYAGKTSLIITTDHGRGTIPKESWRSHGKDIDGADQIWIAAIGPGIRALGESKENLQFFQNQVAATVATLIGINYNQDKAGKAIKEIVK